MSPFIVYALPRSRTAWLARFLTYGGWACGHELAITMRSIDDVLDYFSQSAVGSVETAAAQGWRLLHHYVPDLRAAVIRRPVEDVVRSMLAVDIEGVATYDVNILRRNMVYGDRMLTRISRAPGVLTLDYADLDTEGGCAAIFEHCLSREFDPSWWRRLRQHNIQIDVKSFLRYYQCNRESVEGFKRTCKSELRRLVYSGELRSVA